MSINLNDDAFNASEGGPIFNNGDAGVVNNVTLSLEKKKADDKEKAPDYKIMFTDSNGGTANLPFWYVTEKTQWKSVEELITKQGKELKHLAHAILGNDYKFPSFSTAQEMLDGVMKALRDGLKSKVEFRTFANYGSVKSIKQFIQIRTWVPFIEPMSVPEDETRLHKGTWDAMERLEKDDMSGEVSDMDTGSDDDDDDW